MFLCPYDHHKAATDDIIGWRNVAAKNVHPLLAQKVSKEIGFSRKVKLGVGKSNHIQSASCMMVGPLAGDLSYVTCKEPLREKMSTQLSPSKVHFNSCKDVALSLKSQLETNGANPPEEGAMMLVEGDSPVEFELLHTNPLKNVVAEDEAKYANPCRDMVLVVDNHQNVQKNKKRKRKTKALKNDKSDFNGLGVINVNSDKIDLQYLARDANDEFEAKLSNRTEGMVRDAEFMVATILGDGLPKNWKILLSLRPPCLSAFSLLHEICERYGSGG